LQARFIQKEGIIGSCSTHCEMQMVQKGSVGQNQWKTCRRNAFWSGFWR